MKQILFFLLLFFFFPSQNLKWLPASFPNYPWLRWYGSSTMGMFEEYNLAVSCSAEKVKKAARKRTSSELSANCVAVWRRRRICCTCTEMWKVKGSKGSRRKIAQDSCDSDGDKPSSHQTRSPYPAAGGVRLASSGLPGKATIRLCLSSGGKRANIKSFLAIKKTMA